MAREIGAHGAGLIGRFEAHADRGEAIAQPRDIMPVSMVPTKLKVLAQDGAVDWPARDHGDTW